MCLTSGKITSEEHLISSDLIAGEGNEAEVFLGYFRPRSRKQSGFIESWLCLQLIPPLALQLFLLDRPLQCLHWLSRPLSDDIEWSHDGHVIATARPWFWHAQLFKMPSTDLQPCSSRSLCAIWPRLRAVLSLVSERGTSSLVSFLGSSKICIGFRLSVHRLN